MFLPKLNTKDQFDLLKKVPALLEPKVQEADKLVEQLLDAKKGDLPPMTPHRLVDAIIEALHGDSALIVQYMNKCINFELPYPHDKHGLLEHMVHKLENHGGRLSPERVDFRFFCTTPIETKKFVMQHVLDGMKDDPGARTQTLNDFLFQATIMTNHTEIVTYLVNECGGDPNLKVLLRICDEDLKFIGEVNTPLIQLGFTAWESRRGHSHTHGMPDMTLHLVDNLGANINELDSQDHSVLYKALLDKKFSHAATLIQKGADIKVGKISSDMAQELMNDRQKIEKKVEKLNGELKLLDEVIEAIGKNTIKPVKPPSL